MDGKINYIFIPGFLDTAKYRKMEPGLEIWLKNIKPDEPLRAEYIIGHSLGANFALLHWQKIDSYQPLNKKKKNIRMGVSLGSVSIIFRKCFFLGQGKDFIAPAFRI